MDELQVQAGEAEEAGNLPLALELWRERAKSDTDGVFFLKYGRMAQELEKWDEAESAYDKALGLKPNSFFVKELIGSLWSSRTDKDRSESLRTAKDWFLSALETNRNAHLLTFLGAAYAKLGDDAAARSAFEEAIEIDPNYEEAMYNLAVVEEEAKPERACELLERAIQCDPDYAKAHFKLGSVFIRLKDLDRAEQSYRRALELDPADYWFNLFLASLLMSRKKYEESEYLHRRAIDLRPNWGGGYEFLARLLDKLGRVEEAAAERAKIDPSERTTISQL